jgi:hypothetical protein
MKYVIDGKTVVFTKRTPSKREFRIIQQGQRFYVDEWLDKYSSWTEHVDGAADTKEEAIAYINQER